MCRSYCPNCDIDITNDLYEFWREESECLSKKLDYECPECHTKLKTYCSLNYELEEIETVANERMDEKK